MASCGTSSESRVWRGQQQHTRQGVSWMVQELICSSWLVASSWHAIALAANAVSHAKGFQMSVLAVKACLGVLQSMTP